MKKFLLKNKNLEFAVVETDGFGRIDKFMITGFIGKDFPLFVQGGFPYNIGDIVDGQDILSHGKEQKLLVLCYDGDSLIYDESGDFREETPPTPLEGISFEIKLPLGVDPETVNLSFPKTKYDKKLQFAYVTDDHYNIWNNIYSIINRRWHEEESPGNTYHMGMPMVRGYVPLNFLTFTDGCGVHHRFQTSVAGWSKEFASHDYNYEGGALYPYTTAKEMRFYKNFGGTFLYHDLEPYPSDQEVYNSSLASNSEVINTYIGYFPKIMIEPNGDESYLTYGKINPLIQMQAAQNHGKIVYPHRDDFTLDKNKVTVARDFNTYSSWETYRNHLISVLRGSDQGSINAVSLLIGAAHRTDSAGEPLLFEKIWKEFGSGGLDDIAIITLDEYFEYWYLRENSEIEKFILDDRTVQFKIKLPEYNNFYFPSLSVFVDGITALKGISMKSSESLVGFSYGIKNEKLLINFNYDSELLGRVEEFVKKAETTQDSFDFQDAEYFVQLLKPELKPQFQGRLDILKSGKVPEIRTLLLNDSTESSVSTSNHIVLIKVQDFLNSKPFHISVTQVSGSSDWAPIKTDQPLSYPLKNIGENTLYVKVRNGFGEGAEIIRSVIYNGENMTLNSISINQGSIETENQNVEVAFAVSGIQPLQYRLSENENFIGSQWEEFALTVPFSLSSGFGEKTLYAQVKNGSSESVVVFSKITYKEPQLIGRKIIQSVQGNGNFVTYEEQPIGTVNIYPAANHAGYGERQLKDTNGNNFGFYKCNYDWTTIPNWIGLGSAPTFNASVEFLKDSFIPAKYFTNHFSVTNSAKTGALVYRLPKGKYNFKIYDCCASARYTEGNMNKMLVSVNDGAAVSAIAPILYNTTEINHFLKNVTVGDDGIAVIKFWNTDNVTYAPGVSVIVIEEVLN